jgi:hypothetical protein
MKITIVKKAETKSVAGAQCPWIVEAMADAKRK